MNSTRAAGGSTDAASASTARPRRTIPCDVSGHPALASAVLKDVKKRGVMNKVSFKDIFELRTTIVYKPVRGSEPDLDTSTVRDWILSQILQPARVRELGVHCAVTVVAPGWHVSSLRPHDRIDLPDKSLADITAVSVWLSNGTEDVGALVPGKPAARTLEDIGVFVPAPDKGEPVARQLAARILAQAGVQTSGPPPTTPLGTASQLTGDDVAFFRALVDADWDRATRSGSYDPGSTPGDFKMAVDPATVRDRCPQLWQGLVRDGDQPLVLLRRTDASALAPRPMWIPWHVDVTAARTVQIPLTSAAECDGGRFMYVDGQVVRTHPREVGVPTLHSASLVHAVTPLIAGVRYSLFLLFGSSPV